MTDIERDQNLMIVYAAESAEFIADEYYREKNAQQ